MAKYSSEFSRLIPRCYQGAHAVSSSWWTFRRHKDKSSGYFADSLGVFAAHKRFFLRRRLDSIMRQTFGDFEVIILDDASTDSSQDVWL
jgi:glycosyl transferase family 2